MLVSVSLLTDARSEYVCNGLGRRPNRKSVVVPTWKHPELLREVLELGLACEVVGKDAL